MGVGPKVFVSAGEVSGDGILGAILARLRARYPEMELRGLGGASAMASGLQPLFPMERTAFSGAWDVLRNLRFALGMYAKAAGEMRRFKPDLVLLVDYPGLNLRLARLARSLGVPVLFVAPPQVWAYKKPARKLRRAREALRGASVHVLFPFEKAWYEGAAGEISVGHFFSAPVLSRSLTIETSQDAIAATQDEAVPSRLGTQVAEMDPVAPSSSGSQAAVQVPDTGGLVCLCPGSRLPVLRRNLPVWLNLLRQTTAGSQSRYAVLVPPHLHAEAKRLIVKSGFSATTSPGEKGMSVVVRTDKSNLLLEASAAIAFPGTITLELALARLPTLVLAIIDPLTLALGRRVLGHSRLALPNLILKEDLFPEWVGTAPGPTAEVFRELLGRRDGMEGWVGRLEKLGVGIGDGGGAEACLQSCLKLLQYLPIGK